MWRLIIFFLICASEASPVTRHEAANPTVTIRNGTYEGIHSLGYDQDFFLGVPFAQPPVKSLRFKNPASLTEGWKGVREAKKYSAECVGYGVWTDPITSHLCNIEGG